MASSSRTLTQAELLSELQARFGGDPMGWAFRCPSCGDVATARDFTEALATHPRRERDGRPTMASDIIGQECIGRTLGALKGPASASGRGEASRGCDWCAYGLFKGPWKVDLGDGKFMHCFPIAPAPKEASNG